MGHILRISWGHPRFLKGFSAAAAESRGRGPTLKGKQSFSLLHRQSYRQTFNRLLYYYLYNVFNIL